MIRKILIVAVLLSIGFPVLAQKKNKKSKAVVATVAAEKALTDYKLAQSAPPPLRIANMDGSVFTNESLMKDKPLMLVLFNPTCGHCSDQSKMLLDNYDQLVPSQIQLVYSGQMPPELVKEFYDNYAQKDGKKLAMGLDASDIIQNLFLYKDLPQTNIYDRNHKLVKVFNGNVSVDSLNQYLR